MDRRDFMKLGGAAGVVLLARETRAFAQDHPSHVATPTSDSTSVPPATRGARTVVAPGGQIAVVTPNGSTLPMHEVGGVKVGHLVVSELEHEFAPGLVCTVWGYNG